MKSINLTEINLDNIGSWPTWIKALAIGSLMIVILCLGYYFDWQHQLKEVKEAKQQHTALRHQFEVKQQQAANLAVYREQLKEMKIVFGKMLRQLPGKAEVPGLLEDISKVGVANGLAFKRIKPLPEKKYDFYAELPIEISVEGSYHQIAMFVSALAKLDRIVTLGDFTIRHTKPDKTQAKDAKGNTIQQIRNRRQDYLEMNMTATTYRYLSESEEEEATP